MINKAGRLVKVAGEDWDVIFGQGLREKGFKETVFEHDNPNSLTNRIMIERPMGGLGDILCMKPAIEDLAKIHETTFVAPSQYQWMFRTNKEIEFIDYYVFILQYSNNIQKYRKRFDLDCPAGDHEQRTDFRPIDNRIENFAKALGMKPRKPILEPNPEMREERFNNITRPKIGLVLETANPCKTYPLQRWVDLAFKLQEEGFYPITISPHKNFNEFDSVVAISQERLTAVLSQLDVIVTGDTGTLHLAGAMDIPCIGLFGPTDGDLTVKYYNSIKIIQKLQGPTQCYRPCYYSVDSNGFFCAGNYGSCMYEISIEEIHNAICQEYARQSSRSA